MPEPNDVLPVAEPSGDAKDSVEAPPLPDNVENIAEPSPFPAGAKKTSELPFPAGATKVSEFPSPAETPIEPEDPSIGDKIVGRFLGTDIEEDPLLFTRLGTTVAGAIAGGIAGTQAGTALGALTGPGAPVAIPILGTAGLLIGGGIGAFGGAQAPEAFLEAGEALGVFEEGTRDEIGLSPEELRTVAEGEALVDIATGGGLTVLRLGGRLTGKLFTGASKEVAERAAGQGIDLLPVQVGNRIIGRGFVTVFGRFPLLGGGAIRRRGGKAEKQLKDVITGLVERTGPITDAPMLGVKIFADATELVKKTNKYFKGKYEEVFARAEEFGVRVVPFETLSKADEILKKILAETPVAVKGKGELGPGKAIAIVKEFIENEILPLRRLKQKTFDPEGIGILDKSGKEITRTPAPFPPEVAMQSLKQMDGLVTKIDQQIGSLEPGQKRFALSLLKQLRQASLMDVTTNTRGLNADEIGKALRAIDTEFSYTMSQLFDTATAKRFASVKKRGLRAIEFDEATRTPIDQLARIVVNLESPQAMDELARLVSPETLQRIAARTLDDAMQMAMKSDGFVGQLDIEIFARRLGLDGTNEARRGTIQRMLDKSGSGLTAQNLDDIVEAGRVLAGFDLPNVSSFIARRGAIGGISGVLNGVVPGIALLGGFGAAAVFSPVAVLGAIMLVGGSHMFARVISNPAGARALSKVFDKEASGVIRRKATVELLAGGLKNMRDLNEITTEQYFQLRDVVAGLLIKMDEQFKSMVE